MDPIVELKARAEILHRRLSAGDTDGITRLRALPELRRAEPAALVEAARTMTRKHCLAVVALECGFSSWEHARRVLQGDLEERDVGTLLYDRSPGASGALHPWFASYDEARAAFDESRARGGRYYLLGYKKDFFLTEAPFVARLGLDPEDPDWESIGWDWARPAAVEARGRLFHKRLQALRTDR